MTGMPPKRDPLNGQKTLKVAGFLEEFEIDDIKKRVDIIELFESFGVKLTKSGKNYIGLCPFHDDKSPSLSVDREKGLFNCFSGKCGVSGSVVDAVMNIKNTDFKGAKNYLKEWKGLSSYSPISADLPLTISKSDSYEPPAKPAGQYIPEVSISTIAGHYHKKLYDNPEALEYLKKRGLTKPELYERFQIGFSDGSLLSIIGETQKQALTEAGIISEKGQEHFKNCLIFPIFDDNGQTISFYGRDISEDSNFKHRYLKGKHRGVFNRKASKVYDEIILTECIIDALSLIETGLENVQAIYGTNGFTDEHLEILKTDRVKMVIIALDNDEAGQKASQALKERLINEGFKVKIFSPYGQKSDSPASDCKDWNESLVNGVLGKNDLTELINQLAVFEKETEPEEKQPFKVREEKGQFYFTCLDITYRFTGVKEMFVNSLRVTIRADHAEDFFIDTVDLYLYRARSAFASHLSRQFGIEPRRIERDLLNILEYLEKQRDKKLLSERPSKIEITDDERQLGMELLKDPDLLDTAAGDMTTAGYAGEKVNKQLVYLAGTSRLLSKPLSIYIQSGAGSGKSYLIETVLKLMPPEKVNSVTSVSDRAMNYLEEEKLLDCILAMGEALHNEEVERDIRQMQSENMISRSVTMKDPKTGEMKTAEIKKKVRLSFMMTSTALKLNPENASRCLVLNVDESREQTGRVMELQRHKKTFDGYLENKHVVPKIIQKHISAQRMLTARNIFNPFSKGLRFPLSKSIFRRAHEQFLTLIDSVCFLLQYQKRPSVLFDHYGNEEIEGLECGLPDYGIARRLFIEGGILSNIYDIPPVLVELSEEIRKFAIKKAVKEGIKANEVSLIQSDIRDITDLSNESVKRYIRMLVEYEFLKIVSGKKNGTRFSYSLRENQPIKGLDLEAMIPAVEEMELIINSNNDNGLQNRKKLIII
jgi:DNA primase catalytic core